MEEFSGGRSIPLFSTISTSVKVPDGRTAYAKPTDTATYDGMVVQLENGWAQEGSSGLPVINYKQFNKVQAEFCPIYPYQGGAYAPDSLTLTGASVDNNTTSMNATAAVDPANPGCFTISWDTPNTYREHELALPIEASPEERKELVDRWCHQNYKNHAYLYAIHCKEGNPHCHIMVCDRRQDGIERTPELFFKREATAYRDKKTKELKKTNPARGGCPKSLKWNGPNRNKHLQKMRQAWAEAQNDFYKSVGLDIRVDHRTLAAQRKEALDEIELLGLAGDAPKVKAEIKQHRKKAAALDREADQRISSRRYRGLQRSGKLSGLQEYRNANREASATRADLYDAREQQQQAARRTLHEERTRAWERELERRRRYRSNCSSIHSAGRIAASLLPQPLGLAVKVAAELLVAACVFRPIPATVPTGKRPPFRRQSGHHSAGNPASVPEQSGQYLRV